MVNHSDLFTAAPAEITFEMVRRFILESEAGSALSESSVVELKAERHGTNVVDAVQALSNTDGGLVLSALLKVDPVTIASQAFRAMSAMRS